MAEQPTTGVSLSEAKFFSIANTSSHSEFMDIDQISFRKRFDTNLFNSKSNFLIVSDMSTFETFFESFKKMTEAHCFSGALIYDNSGSFSNNFAFYAEHLKARAIKKLYPSTKKEVIARIVHAWSIGAEGELIADAFRIGDYFNIIMCDIKTTLAVPISSLPSLENMNDSEKSNFKIDRFGRHIHWPELDLHMNSDTFRCAIDPIYKEKMISKNLRHTKNFGEKLVKLRKAHDFTQNEFRGLSDKQVRRFEQGKSWPTYKALNIIAKKYKFSINELLLTLNKS